MQSARRVCVIIKRGTAAVLTQLSSFHLLMEMKRHSSSSLYFPSSPSRQAIGNKTSSLGFSIYPVFLGFTESSLTCGKANPHPPHRCTHWKGKEGQFAWRTKVHHPGICGYSRSPYVCSAHDQGIKTHLFATAIHSSPHLLL